MRAGTVSPTSTIASGGATQPKASDRGPHQRQHLRRSHPAQGLRQGPTSATTPPEEPPSPRPQTGAHISDNTSGGATQLKASDRGPHQRQHLRRSHPARGLRQGPTSATTPPEEPPSPRPQTGAHISDNTCIQ